jgi:hypothetical protein
VDIDVTLQTVRELLEHDFTVRLAVAFLTLRNIFMFGMVAFHAGYLTVLAYG